MANFNLTSQQLKDTYEQLVQVSGSALVNGTGSLVNAFDYPSNSTFTTFSSSVASTLSTIVAGSGSADWSLITNKPAGLVSSSAQTISNLNGSGILSSSTQIASQISGAFTSTSASLAADITTNKNDIATKLATSTFTSYSSSVSSRLTTDESNITTNASNISTQTSRVNSLVAATSSYAVKSSNNTFTGTQTFNNIAVNGTASIAYLEQVTGSAVIIGEEFIILNTSVPAARYAGIKVYDTGSNLSTASFLFDGVTNDWFYEYTSSDATNFGVVLFGPEYGTIGTPSYPTSNVIQKGMGGHHLVDSNITDNGTSVSVSTPFTATQITASTGFKGNLDGSATTATSASYSQTSSIALNVGLVPGSSVRSIKSSDYVLSNGFTTTYTPATASGDNTIAIGEGAKARSNNSLAIGKDAVTGAASGDSQLAIGDSATTTAINCTAVGKDANASSGNATALGYSSNATGANATAISNATAGGTNAVAVGEGANASNTNTTAVGVAANATGDEAVAIGTAFGVSGNNALGIGRRGSSTGDSSIAIGSLTEATANNAIAIGASVTATSSNAINIGNRFKFDGVESIFLSGSVTSSIGFSGNGNGLTVSSGSSTGSFVDNIHPAIASSSAQIKHIVTLNQNQYSAITGSDDTLYIITDSSASVVTNLTITGQLALSGSVSSEVTNLTIASSTASVDLSTSNFFEKSLTAATFLANPTNAKPGSTYTFKFDSGSLITNYGTDYLFAGGTNPTLSNGQDIVTFVSFVSGSVTKLYGTGLANFS